MKKKYIKDEKSWKQFKDKIGIICKKPKEFPCIAITERCSAIDDYEDHPPFGPTIIIRMIFVYLKDFKKEKNNV